MSRSRKRCGQLIYTVSPNIFVIAGEASGDLHGAGLVRALKDRLPGARFAGIGGPKMQEAGLDLLFPSSQLAVVGLVEVFSHLRPILNAFRRTVNWLRKERPDLLILIDYPDFNLLVAGKAKRLGIPVFYYISPQVWAWRRGRVRKIRRLVNRMGVILPFEEDFFRRYGMEVDFVGHPLLDCVEGTVPRREFRECLGLDSACTLVGFLPGSRHGEISRMFPIMAVAARRILDERPDIRFVVPLAPSFDRSILESLTPRGCSLGDSLKTVHGRTYDAMAAADLLVAASGTVTLEAAILGVSMIVTYKVSPLTHFLGRRLIRVPYVSLVNLVAGREVVPEILQDEATPERIAREVLSLLKDGDRRDAMVKDLGRVRAALGTPGAANRAAGICVEILQGRRESPASRGLL
jgi:lipid-A-disaccharide synthase